MGRRTRLVDKPTKAPKHPVAIERPKVDPRVWKRARQIAKGDVSRIDVLSTTEVVVRNYALKHGR